LLKRAKINSFKPPLWISILELPSAEPKNHPFSATVRTLPALCLGRWRTSSGKRQPLI
jgi:hypothetical protein